MGVFEKIFGKSQSPKGETVFRLLNGYTPSFSNWKGELYESELVRASVDAIARHCSKLDFATVGTAKENMRSRLAKAPNEWQTWGQFFYRLATIYEIKNTAFIVPILDSTGATVGIYPIYEKSYKLVEYKGEPWLRFEFEDKKTAAIELSRVGILVKHQLKSDYFGESNKALNPTMDLISIQNQGIKEGVKSGASFRFMATMSNWSNDTDLKKERDKFTRENMSKGGGLLLFPNIYKDIKQITNQPFVITEGQMNIIRTNAFEYFGVNEDILQNKASDSALGAFYDGKIEPFAVQTADVLTRMLYTLRERQLGNKVLITANKLQYMSTASKVSMVKELTSVGAIKIDEIRELFNYAPIGGEEGAFMPVRGEYYDLTEKSNGVNGQDQ